MEIGDEIAIKLLASSLHLFSELASTGRFLLSIE